MYNKLFESILDSSIWLEDNPTRIVWFTFLAAMKEDGFARFATVRNLAARARVTEDEATQAVATLEAPDPGSSDPDNEGRRIERVPGGWIVLNAPKYKETMTRVICREQTRQRVARFRENQARLSGRNADVTDCNNVKQKVTAAVESAASDSDSASASDSDSDSDSDSLSSAEGETGGIDSEATSEDKKPRTARRARNHEPAIELTEDWLPTDNCLKALCSKYECEAKVILAHLPDFKLYWIHEEGAGTLKKPCGWNSTFRNRIDHVAGWGRLHIPNNAKGKSKHGPLQPSDTSDNGWLASTMREQRSQGPV